MKRINKTQNNLQQIWQQLDDACGNLDNALENMGRMVLPKTILDKLEIIDITKIISLKDEIEKLLDWNNRSDDMYIESIIFKREKDSEWEQGYYIGKTSDNNENNILIDKNFNPILNSIWDLKTIQ